MKHGTTAAYARHGCRCDTCRLATSKRSKMWRLQRLRGVEHLVDAQPLRDHVAMLQASGMSFKAIALTAGWASRNALADSMTRNKVMPRTMARVLAVHPDRDGRRDSYVDATGASRRLRALAVIGWPSRDLASRLGHKDPATIQHIASGQTPTVRLRTMDAIRDLYDALWDQPGPSRRAETIARRKGWLPPLAWDDDRIDDPGYRPEDVRRTTGRGTGVTVEDIEDAREQGYESAQAIGWRLGVSASLIQKVLSRAGQVAS